MDISAIAAAQTAIKGILDLTRGMANAAVDQRLKDRLIEVQQRILDAQSQLGNAHAERIKLLEETAQLRGQLREAQEARAALEQYELHEIQAGLFVYRTKPKAQLHEHFACPRCYSQNKVGVMQSTHQANGQTRMNCSVCSYAMLVGSVNPPSLRQPGGGWMGT